MSSGLIRESARIARSEKARQGLDSERGPGLGSAEEDDGSGGGAVGRGRGGLG